MSVVEINGDQLNEKSKAVYSELALGRESATVTWALADSQTHREREALDMLLASGATGGRRAGHKVSSVIGWRM